MPASTGWERHLKHIRSGSDRLCLTGDSAGDIWPGWPPVSSWTPSLQEVYGSRPLAHPFRALAIAHGVCDVYRFNVLKPHLDRAVTREYLRMLLGPAGPSPPLWGHASFEDTAPGLSLPHPGSSPVSLTATTARAVTDRLAGPAPLEHETLHWTRAQGSASPMSSRSATGTGRRAGRPTTAPWTFSAGPAPHLNRPREE